MVQSEIIEKIKRYCLLLNRSGIKVDKAFLYGSWARNEAGQESDIDVMIVSSAFDKNDQLLKSKAWRLTEQVDLRIEPYIISLRKFLTDDVSPLLQIVKKDGVEIHLT